MSRSGAAGANASRVIALVLIVAGALGLAYGKFSVTDQTHTAQIGEIGISVQEKRSVNVPMWVGVGAIVAGAVLLVSAGRGARA